MRNTAEENRRYVRDELHLFTFEDGKQFEYYLKNQDAPMAESYLYKSQWTEEPNESIQPEQITEDEFEDFLNDRLSEYSGARYQLQEHDEYDEMLYIYTAEPLAMLALWQQAEVMKNYIDSKPDKNEYLIVFEIPMAAEGYKTVTSIYFSRDAHKITRTEVNYVNEVQSSATVTTVSDGTYTSIVRAIDTGTLVNHPRKWWVEYE